MRKIIHCKQAFGKILRQERENISMTQIDLAIAIDGSERGIRRMENFEQAPTLSTFLLLAEALGISPQVFIEKVIHEIAYLNDISTASLPKNP